MLIEILRTALVPSEAARKPLSIHTSAREHLPYFLVPASWRAMLRHLATRESFFKGTLRVGWRYVDNRDSNRDDFIISLGKIGLMRRAPGVRGGERYALVLDN